MHNYSRKVFNDGEYCVVTLVNSGIVDKSIEEPDAALNPVSQLLILKLVLIIPKETVEECVAVAPVKQLFIKIDCVSKPACEMAPF